jgi:hypothetical protein
VSITIERAAKDGKKNCFAMIALNYRNETEKNKIILIIFKTFFDL